MTKVKEKSTRKSDLRRRAEEVLEQDTTPQAIEGADFNARRLVQELQVHQIELEMQNQELQRTHAELEAVLTRYTDLYDFAPVGYLMLDSAGKIYQINLYGARLLGIDRAMLQNHPLSLNITADDLPAFWTFLQRVFLHAMKETCEVGLLRSDGQLHYVRLEGVLADSAPLCRVVMIDITERRQAENLYHLVTEHSNDVIWTMNLDREFTYVSPSVRSLLGYEPAELQTNYYLTFTPQSLQGLQRTMSREVEDYAHGAKESVYYVDVQHVCKDGSLIWAEILLQRILNQAGEKTGYLGVSRNITARKEAEAKLQHLSAHDMLTGLYNRSYFQGELTAAFQQARFPLSIIMADVDGLKVTNDKVGHAAGDVLLRHAARVLSMAKSDGAVVARIGGDEFVVLLSNASEAEATVVLDGLRAELLLHNRSHMEPVLRISFGLATTDGQVTIDELLSIVDARMYDDKRAHKKE